jgi:hypothetical protein
MVMYIRFCGYVRDQEEDGVRGDEVLPDGIVGLEDEDEEGSHKTEKKRPALLVFFSNTGLYTMRMANEISLDGTFATCPDPFKQIVFLHAKQLGKRPVPVVFALLSNKVTGAFLDVLVVFGDFPRMFVLII